jgi:hypothetical protein
VFSGKNFAQYGAVDARRVVFWEMTGFGQKHHEKVTARDVHSICMSHTLGESGEEQ